jgi:hypothetical protein
MILIIFLPRLNVFYFNQNPELKEAVLKGKRSHSEDDDDDDDDQDGEIKVRQFLFF